MSKIGIDTFERFDKGLLACNGVLYPESMEFEICSPTVNQIRKWHSMNDENPLELSLNIIEMIEGCVRVKNGDVKDIYEHDKLAFLIAIFNKFNVDNKLEHNLFVTGQCPHCEKTFEKLVVQISNLTYKAPSAELIEKYLDKERGVFVIKTKKFGDIEFKPSTLGVGKIFSEWTSSLQVEFLRKNQSLVIELQSLFTDWRGLTKEKIRKVQVEEYNLFSDERKLFQMQLMDNFNVTIQNEVEFICPECAKNNENAEDSQNTFRVLLPFEQINRTMFTPVSSFLDELL